jgi:DNA-binding NarL/FixJ family response regulator
MNRSLLHKSDKSTVVLVIDSLELRRAGVVSFLAPWANDCKIEIVQIDPGTAVARSDVASVKMILLVIGAQGVAEAEPQSWIASLHERYAETPLVLVSEREEPDEVVAAFKAGARGFVPMSVTPPVAMQALTFIMSGGSFFPPTALLQRTHSESSVTVIAKKKSVVVSDVHGLTARQQEVLERLRQGESNKLIGRQLKLRESTVKVHIRQIMRKLGATNRTQAALCAAQLNLTSRDKSDESEEEAGEGGVVCVRNADESLCRTTIRLRDRAAEIRSRRGL